MKINIKKTELVLILLYISVLIISALNNSPLEPLMKLTPNYNGLTFSNSISS